MEQKKMLWIILSVSLFVLVIFGVALFLYSPARSHNAVYAGGERIPYEASFHDGSTVDPDQWVRNPDKVAGLDKNAVPTEENVLDLSVAPETPHDPEQDIDVSGLTKQPRAPTSEMPKDLAEQIGIADRKDEKQPAKQSDTKPQTQKTAQKRTTEQIDAIVKPKAVAKQTSAPAVKPAPAKPQTQKLYWVQAASLSSRLNAEKARDTLTALHMKAEIFTKTTASGVTYRVRVGPFNNNTEANYWLKNINKIKAFEKSYVTEELVKR